MASRSPLQLSNSPQCPLHTERPAVQQMCFSLSTPKPFHPSGAPPLPGPTRPPAPVCEEEAPPSLGSKRRAVTNPKIGRGDPRKQHFGMQSRFVCLQLSFEALPPWQLLLGMDTGEMRIGMKADITVKQRPFSPLKPLKTELMLQNVSGL